MRTGINPIYGCTFVREEIDHALIDGGQRFKRAVPAAHDGLVADNHDRTAEPIQHSNAFGGSGKYFHAFHGGQVMPLDVYRSIAIEKDDHAG
jgi:hypothetical protein